MIPEFSWRSLTEAINEIQAPPTFLIQKVFKRSKTHLSDKVDVDVIVGGRKLAPFVSPVEGGVVVEKLGRRMDTVKCPRIRVKKPLQAEDLLLERAPGADFYVQGGDFKKWVNQRIALELQDLKDIIVRRTEWMCARALSGKIQVQQENLAFEVDFGLPSQHKPSKDWGAAGADPVKDIRSWKRLIRRKVGFTPDLVVAGPTAIDKLLANEADA